MPLSIIDTVQDLVNKEAVGLSAARRESFEQGAKFFRELLAERGLSDVIGTEAKTLINELAHRSQEAARELERVKSLEVQDDCLDEGARRVVGLTTALLKVFRMGGREIVGMATDSRGNRYQYQSPSKTLEVGDNEAVQIVKAVSYIVWAYINHAGDSDVGASILDELPSVGGGAPL